MKQTAVEWFKSEFEKYYAFSTEEMETFIKMFNQAKQMEKEQIFNSYEAGFKNEYFEPNEYYNETYKNTEL